MVNVSLLDDMQSLKTLVVEGINIKSKELQQLLALKGLDELVLHPQYRDFNVSLNSS